jgi:nitrile hydratase accessory protein
VSADGRIGLMDGAAALPRKNGELVFEAPWEGRAFGMAVALSEGRLYGWDEFRARLVDQIAAADAAGSGSTYYERWLAALESLLTARGLVTTAELDARAAEYAAGQRDDHDHDHDHHDHDDDHDHDHDSHGHGHDHSAPPIAQPGRPDGLAAASASLLPEGEGTRQRPPR